MKDKSAKDYVDAIPEDMRGHVFHELGKSLGHKGGAQPMDGDGSGDDSGGTPTPPPPPGH